MSDQRLYEVKSATLAFLGARWERNYLANRASIESLPGVAALFGKFQKIPAVVAGAGPSLDRNARLLHKVKGHGLIIACDAALRPLASRGVVPDIAVNLDPQLYILNFFDSIDTKNITLVAPTVVHPAVRSAWKGPFFFYNKHAPDIPILAQISLNHPKAGHLVPGGSVLSVAYDLAFKTGADPIAFVGQDLSYPAVNAYASGGHFGEYGTEELLEGHDANIVEATDLFGRTVKTQKSMAVTRQWFAWAFSTWQPEQRRRIFNCSESGILTDCAITPLGEFVSRFCGADVNPAWTIKKAARV